MFTIDQLRALAREAETELSAEVHKFVDWIERKHAPAEITVAERERLAAEQRATTEQISTALAPQTAGAVTGIITSADGATGDAAAVNATGVLSSGPAAPEASAGTASAGAAPEPAAAAADGAAAAGAPAAAGPAPDAGSSTVSVSVTVDGAAQIDPQALATAVSSAMAAPGAAA